MQQKIFYLEVIKRFGRSTFAQVFEKMSQKIDAEDLMNQGQEFMSRAIADSEKAVESAIEYHSAVFKGGEAIAKKMYDHYVTNVGSAFQDLKAMSKAADIGEFYKAAASSMSSTAERWTEQSSAVSELTGKVVKETGEAARLAYTKGMPGKR